MPQINSAEDAKLVVAASKFPPQGLRGQGSAFPGMACGTDTSTYIRTANETLLTCVQIETRAGLENIDEICATIGVGKKSTPSSFDQEKPAH